MHNSRSDPLIVLWSLDLERDHDVRHKHLGHPTGTPDHAKIIFYSRGLRDSNNEIRFPFNIEMNLNHEHWHLRENDPESAPPPPTGGAARIDIKFSFGNCLDENNEVKSAPPFGYVPEIAFRNQSWADYLAGSRFPALAGWQKNPEQIWDVLNQLTLRIFSQFQFNGQPALPADNARYGQGGKGVGLGHRASRRWQLADALPAVARRAVCRPLSGGREPARRRNGPALCLRHVGDAAELCGQPGAHPRRTRLAALAAS